MIGDFFEDFSAFQNQMGSLFSSFLSFIQLLAVLLAILGIDQLHFSSSISVKVALLADILVDRQLFCLFLI